MASKTLLLLPPIPNPPNYAAIKASYQAPLLISLRNSSHASSGSSLDIALPCPQLYGQKSIPRAAVYDVTQTATANLYKLICTLAARERIELNVEDGTLVDVRIILLAYPRDGVLDASSEQGAGIDVEGLVVELPTLAKCHKRWQTIYSVESEQGEHLLRQFVSLGSSGAAIKKLRGGIVPVSKAEETFSQAGDNVRPHFHVAVGGTFDHLHIGHKLLLTMTVFALDAIAPNQERAITVGITAGDLLVNKKYAEVLQDWHGRYAATHAFVHSIISFDPTNSHPEQITEVKKPGPNGHAMIVRYPSGLVINYVEIWDPFGPTITEEKIDALVISAETRSGGKAVNDKRKEQGWRELDVFEVDVLDADEADDDGAGKTAQAESMQQAFQNKLSSTEIRRKQAELSKGRSKV